MGAARRCPASLDCGRPDERRLPRDLPRVCPSGLATAGGAAGLFDGSGDGAARRRPASGRRGRGGGARSAVPGGGRRTAMLCHPEVNQASHNPAYVRGLMGPTAALSARREAAWIYSQAGFNVYANDLRFYSEDFDAEQHLEGLDARTFGISLLTGAYDYSASPDDTRRVAALIPGRAFARCRSWGIFRCSKIRSGCWPTCVRSWRTFFLSGSPHELAAHLRSLCPALCDRGPETARELHRHSRSARRRHAHGLLRLVDPQWRTRRAGGYRIQRRCREGGGGRSCAARSTR